MSHRLLTLFLFTFTQIPFSGVYKSLDDKYIFFESASKETSEVWYLATEEEGTATEMKSVAPRRSKVLYEVEHGHGEWFVWTNVDKSPNMKLMTAPAVADSAGEWKLLEDADGKPVFDGSLAKALDSVTVLNSHIVIQGREGGIPRVWTYSISSKDMKRLEFDEAAYDVGLLSHFEADTKSVAVSYDSLLTPVSSIEISLDDDTQRTVLKTKSVPGYDKNLYGCERLEVLSRDGKTQIPISVVYRKETMEKVKAGERVPVHLYGYGSYGACIEADFRSTRLPLLNRGMIYVIAHIRGGGEMGRQVSFSLSYILFPFTLLAKSTNIICNPSSLASGMRIQLVASTYARRTPSMTLLMLRTF